MRTRNSLCFFALRNGTITPDNYKQTEEHCCFCGHKNEVGSREHRCEGGGDDDDDEQP